MKRSSTTQGAFTLTNLSCLTYSRNCGKKAIYPIVASKMGNEDLGTFGVSRGMTEKTANQKLDELQKKKRSASDKSLIAKYNVDRQQKERLRQIEKDTAVETSRMNGYQKRSVRKRANRKDKSVRSKLQVYKARRYEAAVAAADAQIILNTEEAGFLEPEHEMEFTSSLSPVELKRNHLCCHCSCCSNTSTRKRICWLARIGFIIFCTFCIIITAIIGF